VPTISDKWQQRKSHSGKSAALDKLLAMAGIEDIKRQFLGIIIKQVSVPKITKY
jgi:hypothetical protein